MINKEELKKELEGKKITELKKIAQGMEIVVGSQIKKSELIDEIIRKQAGEPEIVQEKIELGVTEDNKVITFPVPESVENAENENMEFGELEKGTEEIITGELEASSTGEVEKEEPILRKTVDEVDTSNVPVELLDASPLNFFHPLKEKKYNEVKESIEALGLLQPIIVRPKEDGRFEILAGHNRVKICRELGWDTIPAIIKNVDDLEAEEIIADTNVAQRDEKTPMEIAKAYEIKARAIGKRRGKRNDLEGITEKHSWREIVGKEFEVSGMTVERYMRLNNLLPEFQSLLDDGKVNVKTCFELGLIDNDTQKAILQNVDIEDTEEIAKINPKTVTQIKKKLAEKNKLTSEEKKALKKENKEPEHHALSSREVKNIIKSKKDDGDGVKDTIVKFTIPAAYEVVADMFINDQKLVLDLAKGYYEGTVTFTKTETEE